MAFDENDPQITAYVLGELDESQRAAFEASLRDSEDLRRLVLQTRQAVGQLTAELRGEAALAMTDSQRSQVHRAIGTPDSVTKSNQITGHQDRSKSRRRMVAIGTVAASLVLVAGVAYFAMPETAYLAWLPSPMKEQTEQIREWLPDATVVGESPSTAPADESSSRRDRLDGEPSRSTDSLSTLAGANRSSPEPQTRQPAPAGGPAPTPSSPPSGYGDQATMGMSGGYAGMPAAETPDGESLYGSTGSGAEMSSMGVGGMAAGGGRQKAEAEYDYGMLGGEYGEPMEAAAGYGTPDARYGGGAEHGGAMEGADGYGRASRGLANTPEHQDSPYETYEGKPQDGLGLAMPSAAPRGDQGGGPGWAGDRYTPIQENRFLEVKNEPLSTFSIDVDTASYSKVRMYLLEQRALPRPDAVRIEELVNYFPYDYEPPAGDEPFAAHVEVATCPWQSQHRLARIGIKGLEIDRDERPASNLVFLLDVSGSMKRPNKLPLLKRGMRMLVEQLDENDQVAIVVYAGAAGLVLDSTSGDRQPEILRAIERLEAGGSTNGGEGIQLAYGKALDQFREGGVNRVILCTDGDFNVGVTGTDELVRVAEENAKTGVFLSVLGFGMGNHNDDMLERISNKGNGNYAFIDTEAEAEKVLVEEMSGTLVTIAKDVKIQVEFNPAEVAAYRLIGYENRVLAAEDFNDDRKDAGEIGAGHAVTALYEIVPAGAEHPDPAPVDELRYQRPAKATREAQSGELLTLKIRYKQPDGDTSTKREFSIRDGGLRFAAASRDFRFAAAVAGFGMLLRNSQHKGDATFAGVQEIATEAAQGDRSGYRTEFLELIAAARQLSGD
jgi:Ca-activated chloride channel family protein